MKYQEMNEQILDLVGGSDNVKSVGHCMTRLRFIIIDKSKVDLEGLGNVSGVLQALDSGGQIQVVIGTHVPDVHGEILTMIGEVPSFEVDEDEVKVKKKAFDVFIEYVSKIFMPIMGVLIASGLLKGFLAIGTITGVLVETSGTYIILHAISDAAMYFFPIIIGFTAGKAFKTNEIVTAVIGAVLVYPTLVDSVMNGDSLTFVGLPVILLLYTSSVFPIIISAFVASKLEKLFKKIIPQILQMIFVPFFVLTVTSIFAIMVIGPVSGILSAGLSAVVMGVYNFSPAVAGGVLGGFWQVFVIFGLHWGFIPVLMSDMAEVGHSTVGALLAPSILAQAGACFGVFFRTRNKNLKGISASAGFSALLGITEPSIYGVTLALKKPFYATIVGGAIGGIIMGISGTATYAMGIPSLLAIPTYINPEGIDMGFYGLLIGMAVAFVVSMVLTMVIGFDDKGAE